MWRSGIWNDQEGTKRPEGKKGIRVQMRREDQKGLIMTTLRFRGFLCACAFSPFMLLEARSTAGDRDPAPNLIRDEKGNFVFNASTIFWA